MWQHRIREIVVPFAVTVPVPLPVLVNETAYDFLLNVARDFGPSTGTVQIVEVPEHAPPQPAKKGYGDRRALPRWQLGTCPRCGAEL